MNATAIEWTDKVWNPVTGCSKVSEGCRNCYAEALSLRFKRSVGPWNAVNAPQNVILHPERLTAPLAWEKPAKIFVNSMSDLFHELVPDEFIDQVFAVMAATQHHTYQVLTKRPERMAEYVSSFGDGMGPGRHRAADALVRATQGDLNGKGVSPFWMLQIAYKRWPWPLPNVWLGTSTEDQRTADERIPHLLATPAAVRFLSCEPLLGPIDLRAIPDNVEPDEWRFDALAGGWYLPARDGYPEETGDGPVWGTVDWVITGGESGPRFRPMDPQWARDLRDQCQAAGVSYFHKQAGGRTPKSGGRLLDGVEWSQFPEPARAPATV